MSNIDTQSKRSKRVRSRQAKQSSVLPCQSIYIDGTNLCDGKFDVISLQKISNFFQERQIQIQNQQAHIKSSCKKVASWGWEMIETLVVMVETLGGYSEQLQLCLRKVTKQRNPMNSDSLDLTDKTSRKEYILVLDLDETLIHSDVKPHSSDDFVKINMGSEKEEYFVRKRPFMQIFLEKMAQIFDIYVFTAGLKEYADQVLDWIDPQGLIQKRFYRDSCTKQNGTYFKDLKKVHEDLDKVFIIDNSISGFSMNTENGMLIKSWYCDTSDTELKQYAKFLGECNNNKKFKWNEGNIKSIVECLKRKYPRNILN